MIISQFPLLASIAGGAFAPVFGPGILGPGVVGSVVTPVLVSAFAPAAAPVFAPVLASFVGGEIFNLIKQTGAVAQVVLVILLIFSIMSWSVILTKWSSIKRARAQSGRFLRAFRKAQRLQDVAAVSEQFKPSPLVAVFDNAYDEYRRQGEGNINAVQRAAQIASSEELTRLERRLPMLATTGAVAPFIGLFGTVWGIIDAFNGLGDAGAATLRAVAPGISEALITTAFGLFAAIPAVIFYNQFTHSMREFGARMDDFTMEIMNFIERTTGVTTGVR